MRWQDVTFLQTCRASLRYVWDIADDSLASDYHRQVIEVVDTTLRQYLTEGRGSPLEPLSPCMPFMEAGLDSLDMLKVMQAEEEQL